MVGYVVGITVFAWMAASGIIRSIAVPVIVSVASIPTPPNVPVLWAVSVWGVSKGSWRVLIATWRIMGLSN